MLPQPSLHTTAEGRQASLSVVTSSASASVISSAVKLLSMIWQFAGTASLLLLPFLCMMACTAALRRAP